MKNKIDGIAKAQVTYSRLYGAMFLPVAHITIDGNEYIWNLSEDKAREVFHCSTGTFDIRITAFVRGSNLYRVTAVVIN